MRAKLARLAPVSDTTGHLSGKHRVGQQQFDECAKDFLSGDAGESEAVGGFSLPDVEGSVCGGGQVDCPSCSLAACWLVGFFPNVGEAFGPRRPVRTGVWFGSERREAGFHAVG
jgi:hypothetical protein